MSIDHETLSSVIRPIYISTINIDSEIYQVREVVDDKVYEAPEGLYLGSSVDPIIDLTEDISYKNTKGGIFKAKSILSGETDGDAIYSKSGKLLVPKASSSLKRYHRAPPIEIMVAYSIAYFLTEVVSKQHRYWVHSNIEPYRFTGSMSINDYKLAVREVLFPLVVKVREALEDIDDALIVEISWNDELSRVELLTRGDYRVISWTEQRDALINQMESMGSVESNWKSELDRDLRNYVLSPDDGE